MSLFSQDDYGSPLSSSSTTSHYRRDFSGLFGPVRHGANNGPNDRDLGFQSRRRQRQISKLQFEPELDEIGSKDDMSVEAIHFFGLDDSQSSPPLTPKLFDAEDAKNVKKRQRHFSLEDYSVMDESEDSNSMLSTSALAANSKRVRQGSLFFSGVADDAAAFGLSPEKLLGESHGMTLELENDHIASQLRGELEARLLETVCPNPGASAGQARRKVTLELPPQLLPIIAAHILQEAANEPYGIKGCLVHINYESETDCEYWASLDCDPETVSTFELTLTLRQDASRTRGWRNKIPGLVRSLSSFGFGSVLIGTSYKLVKRRKYILNYKEEESMLKL